MWKSQGVYQAPSQIPAPANSVDLMDLYILNPFTAMCLRLFDVLDSISTAEHGGSKFPLSKGYEFLHVGLLFQTSLLWTPRHGHFRFQLPRNHKNVWEAVGQLCDLILSSDNQLKSQFEHSVWNESKYQRDVVAIIKSWNMIAQKLGQKKRRWTKNHMELNLQGQIFLVTNQDSSGELRSSYHHRSVTVTTNMECSPDAHIISVNSSQHAPLLGVGDC